MLSPLPLPDAAVNHGEHYGGIGSSRPRVSAGCRRGWSSTASSWCALGGLVAAVRWHVVTGASAGGRGRGQSRRVVPRSARNDTWFDTVKTNELEEALRVLGFDGFPKMHNRQQVASWIQKLRIPFELVEGALKEVRSRTRKAQTRRKRGASNPSKESDGSATRRGRSREGGSARKQSKSPKFKDGGLNKFSEAQLRTVLNVCGVQSTSTWTKDELVKKMRGMGLVQQDVDGVLSEVAPQSRPPRSGRSSRKKQRPRSRAEREFFADEREYVREFLREEYDDWDDTFESVDDYFEFTMDDEPWESIPWDFDDYLEDSDETQYRSSRRSGGPTQGYYYYEAGQDPWTRASYATPEEPPWQASTWPKQPKMTPEDAMSQALREGWAVETLSHMQACLLLGLSGHPGREEISKARRQMALLWHPDKNPENANAAVAFQLVMAAAGRLG